MAILRDDVDIRNKYAASLAGARYEILEILGKGGMGVVLKARHAKLTKLVAIKVLDASLLVDDASRIRFEREAKAGSNLSHPNLVTVFDFGFGKDNEPYLVMEYVEGNSLSDLLSAQGTLTALEFLDTFIQASKAIQYIHNQNIIHRDIKSSNLMIQIIDEDRYVKLLDFGIAKVLSDPLGPGQNLTTTGMAVGSPPYMSPEQCIGKGTDKRSDIYSLGCVMYECLAGTPPFVGENSLQTIHMHTNEKPTPLSKRFPVNDHIVEIVFRCLEKQPDKRYQNASELLMALTNAAHSTKRTEPVSVERFSIQSASKERNTRTQEHFSTLEGSAIGQQSFLTGGATAEVLHINESRESSQGLVSDEQQTFTSSIETDEKARVNLLDEIRLRSLRTTGDDFQKSNATSAGNEQTQPAPLSVRSVHKTNSRRSTETEPLRSSAPGMEPPWKRMLMPVLIASVALPCVVFGALYLPDALQKYTGSRSLMEGEKSFSLGPEHWTTAQVQLEQALAVTNDLDEKARIESRLGRIRLKQLDLDNAKARLTRAAVRLRPKMNENRVHYFDCILGLGEIYTLKKEPKGEEYLRRARKMAQEWFGNSPQKADALLASAKNQLKKNPKQALVFYDEALATYSAANYKPPEKLVDAWIDSAEISMESKKITDAASRAMKALALVPELKDKAAQAEIERRAKPIVEAGNIASNESRFKLPDPALPATVGEAPASSASPQTAISPLQAISSRQVVPDKPANSPVPPQDLVKIWREQQKGLSIVTKELDKLRTVGGTNSVGVAGMPSQFNSAGAMPPLSPSELQNFSPSNQWQKRGRLGY